MLFFDDIFVSQFFPDDYLLSFIFFDCFTNGDSRRQSGMSIKTTEQSKLHN